MKRILFIVILVISVIVTHAQSNTDIRSGRIIADQSIFIRNRWIDTIANDTTNTRFNQRSVFTAKATWDLYNAGKVAGNNHNIQVNRNNKPYGSDSLKASSTLSILYPTVIGDDVSGTGAQSKFTIRTRGTDYGLLVVPENLNASGLPGSWNSIISSDSSITSSGSMRQLGNAFYRHSFVTTEGQTWTFKQNVQNFWKIYVRGMLTLNGQNSDGIKATENILQITRNPAYTGRSIVQSGSPGVITDAVTANLSQLNISGGNTTNWFQLLGLWSGNNSYILSTNPGKDSVEAWAGYVSGGGGNLIPHIGRAINYMATPMGGTGANIDSLWGVYAYKPQIGVMRNYFGGTVSIDPGGTHTGPVEAVEIYGNIKYQPTGYGAGKILIMNASGLLVPVDTAGLFPGYGGGGGASITLYNSDGFITSGRNATITSSGYLNFLAQNGSLNLTSNIFIADGEVQLRALNAANTITSQFDVQYNNILMQNPGATFSGVYNGSTYDWVFDDQRISDNRGIQYKNNYHQYATARSLMDKGYIDSAITAAVISGGDGNGIYTGSGTLAANVTITGAAKSITYNNLASQTVNTSATGMFEKLLPDSVSFSRKNGSVYTTVDFRVPKIQDGSGYDKILAYNSTTGQFGFSSPSAAAGTVNLGIANTLAYYPSGSASVDDLAAITPSRLIVSNVNGLPIAATTTAVEAGYVNGVTGPLQTQINAKVDKLVVKNTQTASYTLTIADGDTNAEVEMNSASANNLTIPPNSSVAFPIGTQIIVSQYGAGQTTFVPGAGVTIRSADGKLRLRVQYSSAVLIKRNTNEWKLVGDIDF